MQSSDGWRPPENPLPRQRVVRQRCHRLAIPPSTSPPNWPPEVSISSVNEGPSLKVIAIGGELDLDTVHLLTELVDRIADHHPARVGIDMSGVTFFCAAGLSALLRARQTIAAVGGRLVLMAPSVPTEKILAITDTRHLFAFDTATATT